SGHWIAERSTTLLQPTLNYLDFFVVIWDVCDGFADKDSDFLIQGLLLPTGD
ncbi:MAG: hypothetical protein JNK57_17910, partial [Planctomycetaceae bacterium]|nr:hypothetical protein [Planctomycetaceae bacterium]